MATFTLYEAMDVIDDDIREPGVYWTREDVLEAQAVIDADREEYLSQMTFHRARADGGSIKVIA